MSLDQRFALASEALSVDQMGSDNFSKVASTSTPFAYEYSAGVGPQAVDYDMSDVICAMEGMVSNENLIRGVGSFGLTPLKGICVNYSQGQTILTQSANTLVSWVWIRPKP